MRLIDSSCGDLFTVEEFIQNVKDGGFTDYDGRGFFATQTHYSDIEVECSIPFWNPNKALYTHVLWFNK